MGAFRNLETFVWVATLGSFRAAAERLNTTQPAVSQRIAGLEQEFGARLLERGPRAAVPTAKGRDLLGYAQRMLALRAEMRAAVAAGDGFAGRLRLGVAETIVHTWLPRFIEALQRAHPRLELEIEVDISPSLRERLLGHALDLAFLLGPLTAPGLHRLALGEVPVGFIASPRLALPPPPVPLAAMVAHPIITFARGTQPHAALRALLADPALGPVRVHASASLAPVVRMALDGLGIAAVPPAIVREELASGRLLRLDSLAVMPDLAFHAHWPATPDAAVAGAVAAIARAAAQAEGLCPPDSPALSPAIARSD